MSDNHKLLSVERVKELRQQCGELGPAEEDIDRLISDYLALRSKVKEFLEVLDNKPKKPQWVIRLRQVRTELESMVGMKAKDFSPPLDPGIARAVNVLRSVNIETFESCEGGEGHSYAEPTVRFHGDRSEGFRAVAAAIQHGLKVTSLRRIWPVLEGEPTGPWWELTFVSVVKP